MWHLKIYDRNSEYAIEVKMFESISDVCRYLKQHEIVLVDCSVSLDFYEV